MNPNRDLTFSDHLWGWLVYALGWPEPLAGLLAFVVAIAVVAVPVIIVFFLAYCVHAGTRALPRYEDAVDVLTRLDPALLRAFPERGGWGMENGSLDIRALAALKPLLDNEDAVRRDDERLEVARQRVADARVVAETDKLRKKASA